MEEEFRGFSQRQFAASDFDASPYNFNKNVGTFTGTLVFKRWGKSKNIIFYVDMDNGENFICSAMYFNEYLGVPEIKIGTGVLLNYALNTKGVLCLKSVEIVDESTNGAELTTNEENDCLRV